MRTVLCLFAGLVLSVPVWALGLADLSNQDAVSGLSELSANSPRGGSSRLKGYIFNRKGRVVKGNKRKKTVKWKEKRGRRGLSLGCDEPDSYEMTRELVFIVDKKNPFSTKLEPKESAEYKIDHTHNIGGSVTAGVSAEAGAFLAKAASKLDIQVTYNSQVQAGETLTYPNDTKDTFVVRLGALGWRIIERRTSYIPPCTPKKEVTFDVTAPEPGSLDLARVAN